MVLIWMLIVRLKKQKNDIEVHILKGKHSQDINDMCEEMKNKFQQILTKINVGELG
jgi:hypothetical protein